MLPECGYTRAVTPDGAEYTFAPSFVRIASLGHPHEIVQVYADLYGPRAVATADFVLASLCEQGDVTPLIGTVEPGVGPKSPCIRRAGLMTDRQKIILAQHLMLHGVTGNSQPGRGDGKFTSVFDVAQYVSAARVHLGLSSVDAESLSMTEFHGLMELKYPDPKRDDVPDEEEYAAAMAMINGASNG